MPCVAATREKENAYRILVKARRKETIRKNKT
jgi:hypothetical protein